MRFKADIFLFGVVFLVQFFMTFSVIKQMKSKTFKQGLKQSTEIMAR